MSAREIIAHAAWRHEATSGAPSSVANARTLEAFADAGPLARDKWLSSADAILAALPDMIAPLVWTEPDQNGYGHIFSGPYEATATRVRLFIHGVKDGYARIEDATYPSITAAKAAADAHHRAAIMAALNGEAKP